MLSRIAIATNAARDGCPASEGRTLLRGCVRVIDFARRIYSRARSLRPIIDGMPAVRSSAASSFVGKLGLPTRDRDLGLMILFVAFSDIARRAPKD